LSIAAAGEQALMHKSSYLKMQCFFDAYGDTIKALHPEAGILEVGSKAYHGQRSYKALIDPARFAYTGLDLEAGLNVDIVPASGYVWDEIGDDRFSACISGQTFEHNPFFWVTFLEIARVLRPGGLACIIAPGGGHVHRYPYDCWRFYPDSWAALCKLSGLELVETYYEPDHTFSRVSGGNFRDSTVIARKPALEGAALAAFNERLRNLVKPYQDPAATSFEPVVQTVGPCFSRYEKAVAADPRGWFRRLRYVLAPKSAKRVFAP
jgi:SAM-dependent methyltransferase